MTDTDSNATPSSDGVPTARLTEEQFADLVGLTTENMGVAIEGQRTINRARWLLSLSMIVLFVLLNIGAGVLLYYARADDLRLISDGKLNAADRALNSHVIMTVLGATVVQAGAVVGTMGRFLFSAKSVD